MEGTGWIWRKWPGHTLPFNMAELMFFWVGLPPKQISGLGTKHWQVSQQVAKASCHPRNSEDSTRKPHFKRRKTSEALESLSFFEMKHSLLHMAKVSSAPWQAGTVAVHGDDACEWQGGFGCRESTWSVILLLRGILVTDHFGGWLRSMRLSYDIKII